MMGATKPNKGLSVGKPAEGLWRTIRRKGGVCLRAPDGREFEGTAAEVRSCGASPERRKALADALWAGRDLAVPRTAARKRLSSGMRRDTILCAIVDAETGSEEGE